MVVVIVITIMIIIIIIAVAVVAVITLVAVAVIIIVVVIAVVVVVVAAAAAAEIVVLIVIVAAVVTCGLETERQGRCCPLIPDRWPVARGCGFFLGGFLKVVRLAMCSQQSVYTRSFPWGLGFRVEGNGGGRLLQALFPSSVKTRNSQILIEMLSTRTEAHAVNRR